MAKRIYVGGLPYSSTETQIKDLFEQFGQVSDTIVVTDKFSGQSKGFGFVEMASDNEATAAINSLNGSQLGGRTLTVSEAKPREERSGGGSRGGYGGGGGNYGGGGGGRRW